MKVQDFLTGPHERIGVYIEPVKQLKVYDFVNSINTSKEDLVQSSEDAATAEQVYIPYVINKTMSNFFDTVSYANLMNGHYHLDKKLQYDFYKYIVPKKRRYSPWVKVNQDDVVELVKRVYKLSLQKAKVAASLLTPVQIEYLKKSTEKGG